MKVKKLVPALLILVGLGVSACQNNNSASESNHKSSSSKSIKIRKVKPKKSKKSEKAETAESNASSSASSSSSSSQEKAPGKSNGLPGDAGLVDIPKQLQGTWYCIDDTGLNIRKITEHTITVESDDGEGAQTYEVHKAANGFDPTQYMNDQDTQVKYNDIFKGTLTDFNGHQAIQTRGWFQSAGAGAIYYAVTDYEGNPALVQGGGAGGWATFVYWRSENLARANADKKLDGVVYNDSY